MVTISAVARTRAMAVALTEEGDDGETRHVLG
jgi:hypothetical protein